MTARQQIRVGRRLRGERAPIDATGAPSVGDLLHAAREKKGVDLYRAERDTKIRARHLSALEDGDYAELPGAVYTKGFLRNYALYLGLDPVEILDRWHEEQDPGQRSSSSTMVAPPQPLTDPRRGLTFTPSLVVAAVLGLVVVLFVGYVGMQLFRFSQVPELSLNGPSIIQVAKDQTSVELTGSSPAHATVKALDPAGTMVRSTDSDGDGHWSLVLPVQKGSNEFTLTAHDPETGRESPSRQVIIAVAVPASPTPIPTPAPTGLVALPVASADASDGNDAAPSIAVVGDAALEVTSPRNGARSNDPTLTVKGTTNAPSVRATASWASSGKPPAKPDALRLAAKDGTFSGRFVLAPGRWKVTITTEATDLLTSVTQTHSVNVVYNGFAVEVGTTAKGRAWVQISVDGQPVASSGRIMSNGETQVVVAKQTVDINTGVEKVTVVGIQGGPPDTLGPVKGRGVWRIDKGKAPVKLR